MSRYEARNGLLVPSRRIESLDDIRREMAEKEYLRRVRRNSQPRANLPGQGGRPGYSPPVAYQTISFIGVGTPGTTSVTLPATRTTGDVVLVFAMRCDSNTIGSTGTGFTLVWSGGGGSNRHGALYSKVMESASDTATGFTSWQRCVAWTLRGVDQSDPVGDFAGHTEGNTDPMDFDALALWERSDGSSALIVCGFTRATSGSTLIDTGAFVGFTPTADGTGDIASTGTYRYAHMMAQTGFAGGTITDTANSAPQVTIAAEVKAAAA